MRQIVLDAAPWQAPADFLGALREAVGFDEGLRDLDAVVDAMIWARTSESPPYKVRILNAAEAPAVVTDEIALLARMLVDARVWRRDHDGVDVGVQILAGADVSA